MLINKRFAYTACFFVFSSLSFAASEPFGINDFDSEPLAPLGGSSSKLDHESNKTKNDTSKPNLNNSGSQSVGAPNAQIQQQSNEALLPQPPRNHQVINQQPIKQMPNERIDNPTAISIMTAHEISEYNRSLASQGREIAFLTNQVQIESLKADLLKKMNEALDESGSAKKTQGSGVALQAPKHQSNQVAQDDTTIASMGPLSFSMTGTFASKGKRRAFISSSGSDWSVGVGDSLPGGYRVMSVSEQFMMIKNQSGTRKVYIG